MGISRSKSHIGKQIGTWINPAFAGLGTTLFTELGAYFAGGYYQLSGIYKITFSADSTSTLAATLSVSRHALSGAANSGTAAYFAGGSYAGYPSSIEKLTFSGDSTSTLAATLSTARSSLWGAANSGTAAYFAGGWTGVDNLSSPAGYASSIEKLTFSGDTRSTLAATLSTARSSLTGAANSGTAAYFAGGYNSSYVLISGIDKITFSGDTRSTLAATLSSARYNPTGAASVQAAYFAGGYDEYNPISSIDKITFSGDTRSTLAATLSSANWGAGGAANAGTL